MDTMMKPNRNMTTLLIANAGARSSRRFMTGCGCTSSQTTKAIRLAAETRLSVRMKGELNPSSRSNRSSTTCSVPKPSATRAKPR